MTNRTFKIGAVVLGIAMLVGGGIGLSRTALADGDGKDGMMARLHAHLSGHGGHSGHHGGPHAAMAHLIQQLDLTDLQRQDLDQIHHALMGGFHAHVEGRIDERESFVESIADGTMTAYDIETMAGAHLEVFREAISEAAEPLANLINSLDDEQKATVLAHIEAVHGSS